MYVLKLLNGDNAISQASTYQQTGIHRLQNCSKGCSVLKNERKVLFPMVSPSGIESTCKMHFYRAVSAYYQGLVLEKQSKIG